MLVQTRDNQHNIFQQLAPYVDDISIKDAKNIWVKLRHLNTKSLKILLLQLRYTFTNLYRNKSSKIPKNTLNLLNYLEDINLSMEDYNILYMLCEIKLNQLEEDNSLDV
jgi:hypothetical protein